MTVLYREEASLQFTSIPMQVCEELLVTYLCLTHNRCHSLKSKIYTPEYKSGEGGSPINYIEKHGTNKLFKIKKKKKLNENVRSTNERSSHPRCSM